MIVAPRSMAFRAACFTPRALPRALAANEPRLVHWHPSPTIWLNGGRSCWPSMLPPRILSGYLVSSQRAFRSPPLPYQWNLQPWIIILVPASFSPNWKPTWPKILALGHLAKVHVSQVVSPLCVHPIALTPKPGQPGKFCLITVNSTSRQQLSSGRGCQKFLMVGYPSKRGNARSQGER
jgi:hypothetical protein